MSFLDLVYAAVSIMFGPRVFALLLHRSRSSFVFMHTYFGDGHLFACFVALSPVARRIVLAWRLEVGTVLFLAAVTHILTCYGQIFFIIAVIQLIMLHISMRFFRCKSSTCCFSCSIINSTVQNMYSILKNVTESDCRFSPL